MFFLIKGEKMKIFAFSLRKARRRRGQKSCPVETMHKIAVATPGFFKKTLELQRQAYKLPAERSK